MQPFNPGYPPGPMQTQPNYQGFAIPAAAPPWAPGAPAAPQGFAPGAPPMMPQGFPQGPGFAPAPMQPAGAARFNAQALASTEMAGTRFPMFEAPGVYVVEILRTLVSQRKGAFIAECKVLQCDRPDVRAGDTRAWVRTGEYKDKDIVAFLVCASGYNDLDTFKQAMAQQGIDIVRLATACSDPDHQQDHQIGPNPLKGRYLIVNSYPTVGKRDGKTYARQSFQAYQPK